MKYDAVIFDLFGTYEDFSNTTHYNEVAWSGPRISAVQEILAYVDEALLEEDQISSLNCRRR